MHAAIAATHPVTNRRARRSVATAPAPALAAAPADARTLPMRASVGFGVRVAAPTWMWIVGGGVIGGLLLGPLGAIGGAIAGAMLTH